MQCFETVSVWIARIHERKALSYHFWPAATNAAMLLGFGVAMQKLVFTSFLLAAVAGSSQTSKHPFTVDDAATLQHAFSIAVAPDGTTVLYRVTFGSSKGPDTEQWETVPVSGGEPRHLTLPEHFRPEGFTADGKALYGTLQVNKVAQLATMPLAAPNT